MNIKELIRQSVTFAKIGGTKIEESPKIELSRINEYYLYHDLAEEENNEYKDAILDGDIEALAKELADEFIVWSVKVSMHGMQNIISDVIENKALKNLDKFEKSEEMAIKTIEAYKSIGVSADFEKINHNGVDLFVIKNSKTRKILKRLY